MPTEIAPNPAVKRRRFQFSLRVLLAAVFVYCGLWLMTLKMGGRALAQSYGQFFSKEHLSVTISDTVALEVRPKQTPFEIQLNMRAESPHALRGIVYAPAPFILIWNWESINDPDPAWQPVVESGAVYFWIPGRDPKIVKNPPTFNHRQW